MPGKESLRSFKEIPKINAGVVKKKSTPSSKFARSQDKSCTPPVFIEEETPKVPVMRHRLRNCLPFWKSFVTNTLVISWIAFGYNIQWIGEPPAAKHLKNHKSCDQHAAFIDETIADLVAAQSILEVSDKPRVICPLGVVQQKEKLRMIYDARYINRHANTPSFKYEDLGVCENVLRPHDYMMTVDLSKGYHHVDLHDDTIPYMGLEWREKYYVWQSLPFGLAPACWVFTKITRELLGKWRTQGHRCSGYIDDSLHANKDHGVLLRFMEEEVFKDLENCGFIRNMKKSMTKPEIEVKYLGMLINSRLGRIFATEERKTRVQNIITGILGNAGRAHYHTLEILTGNIMSLFWAFGPVARMMTLSIYQCMREAPHIEAMVQLSKMALGDLEFWANSFSQFNGYNKIWKDHNIDLIIHTDAAGDNSKSYGGWAGWACMGGKIAVARGQWMEETDKTSSAHLELKAIQNTIISLNMNKELQGKNILIKTDSQAVYNIIRAAGSRAPQLHDIFKELFWYALSESFSIKATWIPREENELADFYSKLIDSGDVKLNPDIFKWLQSKWGQFSIDLFASADTFQMQPYYSYYWTPTTAGINAFNYLWKPQSYANPPFRLIGKVLRHAIQGQVRRLILIIPFWVTANWWNMLVTNNGQLFIPAVREIVLFPKARNLFLSGPKRQGDFQPNWSTIALLLDFSQKRVGYIVPVPSLG
jgi:ribonuclease HI